MRRSPLCVAVLALALSACADDAHDDVGEPELAVITPSTSSNTTFFKNAKPSFSCPPPQRPGALQQHQQTLYCLDPSRAANDCALLLSSVVNADNQQGAKQFFSKAFTPGEALALWRDRMRKDVKYLTDSKLRLEVCNGDDDNDLVANVRDTCPNTRPLRPTDDRGCETTELPKAPPREAVDLILGQWGLLYDPRCDGAPRPAQASFNTRFIPSEMVYLKPEGGHPGSIAMSLTTPQNQPAGCEQEYQFRATVFWADGTEHYGLATFSSRLSDVQVRPGMPRIRQKPGRAHFWFSKESSANEDAFSPPTLPKKIAFQVRVMNGAGLDSGWSETYFHDQFGGQ